MAELIIAGALIAIPVMFLSPGGLSMPKSTETLLVLGLVIAFLIFSALVWTEKAADEREQLHRLVAGRVAFLTATAVLVAGIVRQTLEREIDPWLVYTLVAMILAKLITRMYCRLRG